MSHPRALRRGTALRALLGVFVLTAAVLGLARPALGHYPVVKGEVVCAVDDQQVVHWEVSNFTDGADRTMVIDEVTITPAGSNLTGITVGQTVEPNHLDDAEPARGTSVFPGDATHEVTLTITASWRRPDGSVSTKEPETRSATVKLPGDCKDTTTTTTTTVPDSTTTTTTTTTVPESTTTTTTAATTTTTTAATTTTTVAPTQVLGTVQERQAGGQAGQIAAQADSRQVAGQQLPRTGSPTLAMSALALALVAFGSVLTRTAHRPAPARHRRR